MSTTVELFHGGPHLGGCQWTTHHGRTQLFNVVGPRHLLIGVVQGSYQQLEIAQAVEASQRQCADLATPVVESIGSERESKFTGKIHKVTVEVGELKKADKALEEKARREYAHKKAMAD